MKNKLESLKISALIPASAKSIYRAWLNSKEHGNITGSNAKISAKKGGTFSAWDNYIKGKNIQLTPYKHIIQSWRTTEFPKNSIDSLLDIKLKSQKSGTLITLTHTNIPAGQAKGYKEGWTEYYFKPMKRYFKDKAS